MVGLPDGAERVRDHLPLALAARSRREQVPHAAAEVGPAEQHVRVQRQSQDGGHGIGQAELTHGHAPMESRAGSTRSAWDSG